MRSLSGKTALVTGAGRGIGRAIATRLAEKGMRLALADIDPFGLGATRRDVEKLGCEVFQVVGDLTEPDGLSELVERVLDRWAGVDLLVNNAGVTYHGATANMPEEEWARLLGVNLYVPVQLTQRLLPSLLARPEAHILNVCSVLGLSGMPRVTAYCTTKFGLVGYSESLRAEYGRMGLGVTALCPGFVQTGLFGAARPEHEDKAPKAPPNWLCTTPEKVARRGVRAIERNERRVVIDPAGWPIHRFKLLAPTLFDILLSLGRGKRMEKKRLQLAAISANQEEALRIHLGIDRPAPQPLRRVA